MSGWRVLKEQGQTGLVIAVDRLEAENSGLWDRIKDLESIISIWEANAHE